MTTQIIAEVDGVSYGFDTNPDVLIQRILRNLDKPIVEVVK